MTQVHFQREYPPEIIDILRNHTSAELKISSGSSIEQPDDVEILVGGSPSKEMIDACPRLQIVIIPWAGVPVSTRELMTDYPAIQLFNLHHNASTTAELALGLLFAAAKTIVPMDSALRHRDWRPRYSRPFVMRLEEKKAFIFGYGEIGSHIGKVLAALGMEVWGIRRTVDEDYVDQWGVQVTGIDRFDDLLPQMDVLLVSAPLTEETRGFINADRLDRMHSGSVLVNVGRGDIIDQAALFTVLKNSKIAAAGLDVWYNYPSSEGNWGFTAPSIYPFHKLDNVVLSPHRGGMCNESDELRMRALGDLIDAFVLGDELPNQIDKELGY